MDSKLKQMDSKLNLLGSGQVTIYKKLNQVQQNLLTRYDENEQVIVAVPIIP